MNIVFIYSDTNLHPVRYFFVEILKINLFHAQFLKLTKLTNINLSLKGSICLIPNVNTKLFPKF